MLAHRHVMWGLISKLLKRALLWHPLIPGTLKLDLIFYLFKCVGFELESTSVAAFESIGIKIFEHRRMVVRKA